MGGAQGRDINGCDTGGASLAPGALNSHLDVKLIKTILIGELKAVINTTQKLTVKCW